MIYNFLKRSKEQKLCFCDNVLPYRSFFVPCSGQDICNSAEYEKSRFFSDRAFSLSGKVDFAYYPDGIVSTFNSDSAFNSEIVIPSSWESEGLEDMSYIRDYAFQKGKFDVKCGKKSKNSVGIYRCFFDVSDLSRRYILSFLQVNGYFEVYLNGKYCGFSDISRGEFDITKNAVNGRNELIVKVQKWSQASFLSGTNKFSATGIVGDIILFVQNPTSLIDYDFRSVKNEDVVSGNVQLTFEKNAKASVIAQLVFNGKEIFTKKKNIEEGMAEFDFSGDFMLYSADTPYLYDLYIKVIENNYVTECTKLKVGFGGVSIIDGIAEFSEQPLKICAVNYNAVYNKDGKLMSFSDIVSDLILIKEYNFNAIQPYQIFDPALVQVCAELGLYVVEKFDIDTKIMGFKNPKKRDVVVKNEIFAPLIMEKVKSLSSRDKARNNVVLWSFGDENGNAAGISSAIDYLKSVSDIPCVYRVGGRQNFEIGTVYHPDVDGLVDEVNVVSAQKPVFMPEYAQSSGVGCASLREFNEVIINTPCCMGGCVTQFCDQIVLNNGFVDDGVFNEKREPYVGALSNRFVCRPVSAKLSDYNKLELTNRSYFATTEHIDMMLEVVKNGKIISRTQLNATILPRQTRAFEVFIGHVEGDMYLNIYYRDKLTDRDICSEQLAVRTELLTADVMPSDEKLSITELFSYLDVRFAGGYIRFCKETGTIIKYVLMGKELLKSDSSRKGGGCFVPNIYRPFVRNMLDKSREPLQAFLRDFKCEYNRNEPTDRISVETEIMFRKNGKDSFIVQDKYVVNSNGIVEVFSVVTPMCRGLDTMDCFGKQIRLNNNFGYITYYGRGGGDSYVDVYEHASIGLHNTTVKNFNENYTVKQECGNRIDVQYAVAVDKDGDGLAFVAKQTPFQLRVSPISDAEIVKAYKDKIIPEQSGVYIDINAFVSGIGNTVNGKPLPQYLIKPTEYILHFDVLPVYNGNKEFIV